MVKIVNSLQNEKPFNDIEDFLNFHMITREEFDETVEKFRNKDIWHYINGEWKLKYKLI